VQLLANTFKTYQCPSSPSTNRMLSVPNGTTGIKYVNAIVPGTNPSGSPGSYTYAETTYAAGQDYNLFAADYAPMVGLSDSGSGVVALGMVPGMAVSNLPAAGAMTQNRVTKIVELVDGTSNTTLLSELAGRPNFYAGRNPIGSINDAPPVGIAAKDRFDYNWTSGDFEIKLKGTKANGSALAAGDQPCVMNCSNKGEGIYSFHSGGANILFADGSIRFVRDSLTAPQLAGLITANFGEVVSID
jgi:prepilin-type processing-associated H-X9-DG protein